MYRRHPYWRPCCRSRHRRSSCKSLPMSHRQPQTRIEQHIPMHPPQDGSSMRPRTCTSCWPRHSPQRDSPYTRYPPPPCTQSTCTYPTRTTQCTRRTRPPYRHPRQLHRPSPPADSIPPHKQTRGSMTQSCMCMSLRQPHCRASCKHRMCPQHRPTQRRSCRIHRCNPSHDSMMRPHKSERQCPADDSTPPHSSCTECPQPRHMPWR